MRRSTRSVRVGTVGSIFASFDGVGWVGRFMSECFFFLGSVLEVK